MDIVQLCLCGRIGGCCAVWGFGGCSRCEIVSVLISNVGDLHIVFPLLFRDKKTKTPNSRILNCQDGRDKELLLEVKVD